MDEQTCGDVKIGDVVFIPRTGGCGERLAGLEERLDAKGLKLKPSAFSPAAYVVVERRK